MATFYRIKIKEVISETATAVSVVFDIPESLKSTFSFKAGQYCTLKATIDGAEVRRTYSICSSPKSGEIKVVIKAVENGVFSGYATTMLKKGDEIEISEPEGLFVLEPVDAQNYIGFAAGSGITPILSMIKVVLATENKATFTLIYGNKDEKSVIFNEELKTLATSFSERFKLHTIFSREKVKNALQGRIDESVAAYFIKNVYKEIAFDAAFLCGPEAMISEVSKSLEGNKIAKENIHFELFTAPVDTEKASQVQDGNTEITIVLDDEEATFTMSQTDDILAASLRNDIDAPYSCQGGVCSSCLAKVTEGKAVMVKNSILTDNELAEGFILTCQAHPTTSKITVDFDDV